MNNNQKATKRALLTSVMALVMCVVMLVGTTFAWFTDTASTGVNKIQAGNLDIELEYKNDTTRGEFKPASKETAVFNNSALWEPGHVECVVLKVSNAGNLALKYKLGINIANEVGSINVFDKPFKLSDFIKFAVIDGESENLTNRDALVAEAGEGAVLSTGYTAENHLLKDGSKIVTLVVWMPTTVGNEANHKTGAAAPTIDLGIKVDATQYTHENDSFNNQYDKDATYLTYPAGVTDEIFDSKIDADYSIPGGSTGKAPAVTAYVDGNGKVQYTADIKTALDNGASTIYLKKNTKGRLMALTDFLAQPNRSSDVTKDITIYANGADFEYGELAINTSEAGKNANFTIKVYDAKNLRVWGNTPNAGVTQNIILENCTYEGTGIGTNAAGGIFFAYGETGTINLTMNNCKVSGSDQGVYFGCDGSLTVKDSSFTECATGIKVSYKGTGTRTDIIENCVFTKCGCTTEMAGSTTYLADDSAAIKYKKSGTGTITLTLKSNTITGTLGDKGDTQIAKSVTVVNE